MQTEHVKAMSQRSSMGLALLMTMVAFALYFYARNAGLFLSVPDEWVYSRSARLIPLGEVGVPSYLYFILFGATNVCGPGYLDCTRMLNIAAMVAAVPFIYMLSRRVAGRALSWWVAVLAVLGPVNTYTAYFMPESTYLLLFWILAWYALKGGHARLITYGAVLGAIIGAMGLVKAHAAFLAVAVVAFLAFRPFVLKTQRPLHGALVSLAAFIAAALLVRFGLGYLFGGSAGLSLFGQIYGSVAPAADDSARYWRLLSLGWVSLQGHAMGMAALMALPMAAVFYFPKRANGVAGNSDALTEIRLFTFFVFGCLLAMTTLFSANVSGSNALESVARLHMRYYNFALPLLLVVLVHHAASPKGRSIARTLPPAVVFGGLALLALGSLLKDFTPWITDSPELRGLTIHPLTFKFFVLLGVLSVAAWVFDTRLGARLFLLLVLPLAIVVSGWRSNVELRQAIRPDAYAQAGIFARQYIGASREPFVIVGSDHSAQYRAMFYVDNPNAVSVVLPPGEPVVASQISPDAHWLLVVGDHALPAGARVKAAFGGFVLARVGSADVGIDFTQGAWPGVVSRAQGLSGPEPWGTWSDGNRVSLEFVDPLPADFSLVLKGHTIGDTDRPVTVVVGSERREIHLPKPQELSLSWHTDGTARTIEFEIPWAQSMKELGVSEDPRKLGLGFVSLRVIPAASPAAASPGGSPQP